MAHPGYIGETPLTVSHFKKGVKVRHLAKFANARKYRSSYETMCNQHGWVPTPLIVGDPNKRGLITPEELAALPLCKRCINAMGLRGPEELLPPMKQFVKAELSANDKARMIAGVSEALDLLESYRGTRAWDQEPEVLKLRAAMIELARAIRDMSPDQPKG